MFQKTTVFICFLVLATSFASCERRSAALPVSPSITNTMLGSFSGGPAADAPRTSSGSIGTLVGAGDIGDCGSSGAEATSRLLDRIPGTIFTTGDNAYMSGRMEDFRKCYDPTWGRHLRRTRPVPGNHEYESGGSGYFSYFGSNAGTSGLGYYSFSEGAWRVIALNSEVPSGDGSAQMAWLRSELSEKPSDCTAVIWHRPLFSSGRNGDNRDMREVWRALYEFNVDLVINGHDHTYERFAPQDPDGRPDAARGIRQFIVGTGGAPLYEFHSIRANSEVRAAVWGVATFTLNDRGYQWQFVPAEGFQFQDSGSASCH
jgi:calcineurin-like phosphoesterase family protein